MLLKIEHTKYIEEKKTLEGNVCFTFTIKQYILFSTVKCCLIFEKIINDTLKFMKRFPPTCKVLFL